MSVNAEMFLDRYGLKPDMVGRWIPPFSFLPYTVVTPSGPTYWRRHHRGINAQTLLAEG